MSGDPRLGESSVLFGLVDTGGLIGLPRDFVGDKIDDLNMATFGVGGANSTGLIFFPVGILPSICAFSCCFRSGPSAISVALDLVGDCRRSGFSVSSSECLLLGSSLFLAVIAAFVFGLIGFPNFGFLAVDFLRSDSLFFDGAAAFGTVFDFGTCVFVRGSFGSAFVGGFVAVFRTDLISGLTGSRAFVVLVLVALGSSLLVELDLVFSIEAVVTDFAERLAGGFSPAAEDAGVVLDCALVCTIFCDLL